MLEDRAAGILLHPTSLPGEYGVGELGHEAESFIQFLNEASATLWQVLPISPVGAGNSPYQSCSAFACSELLISTDHLIEDGLVRRSRVSHIRLHGDRAAYSEAQRSKTRLLNAAFRNFTPGTDFAAFCEREAYWLDDYVLFIALREAYRGKPWHRWPVEIATREPRALREARSKLRRLIDYHRFVQYRFHTDYTRIRTLCREYGVRLVGDMPIFVAHNSADVWAHRKLFKLTAAGKPSVVAGVPPDYFSATGQLWGNPLYDWGELARQEYSWWIQRLRRMLDLFDLVRIDHFRGFESYWEVKATERTAVGGHWVKGPGDKLFETAREQIGELPLIAEDLGLITPAVEQLRERQQLPGMKVLQFAFSGPDNPYLPHNHVPGSVVYTGTHDNDTTLGWWKSASRQEKHFAREYLGKRITNPCREMIRLAYASASNLAIVPMQDMLELGSEARMNLPGTEQGNWEWRMSADQLAHSPSQTLAKLASTYDRVPHTMSDPKQLSKK